MATPSDITTTKKDDSTKVSKNFVFKEIARTELFNNLQDLRHIIFVDIRSKEEYESYAIRDSYFLVDAEKNKDVLSKFFHDAEDKYDQEEKKYKTKPIRRLVIVNKSGEKYDANDERIKFILDCVKENGNFDKVSYLKEGIENFKEKYPFLCLSFKDKEEKAKLKTEEVKTDTKDILTDSEKKYLYSFSRFPTEIVEDKLFIGSVSNSNNKMQLNDLKIKSILEFIPSEDKNIAEFKSKEYTYKNILINNETVNFIDFAEICQYVSTLLNEANTTPLLICCPDGDAISPVIAIAYLMWSKKMNFQMASLSVFQKRSVANPHKYLFTMLTTWDPKLEEGKQKTINSSLFK